MSLSNRNAILIIALVSAFLFIRTVTFDFVSWDDGYHIYENEQITSAPLLNIPRLLSKPTHIPLTYSIWALLSSLSPMAADGVLSPFLFHATNLLIHILNAVLVFLLLSYLVRNRMASLLGALLFAVHPIQVESVAWVSSLKDILSAFFGFGALLLLFAHRHGAVSGLKKNATAYTLITIALLLSFFAKPTGLVFIPVLVLADIFVGNHAKKRLHVSHIIWAVVLLMAGIAIINQQGSQTSVQATTLPQRFGLAADAYIFYLSKMLVPIRLCIDYGRTIGKVLNDPSLPLRVIAVYLFLASTLALPMLRKTDYGKAALLLFILLLPVLGFIPFIFQGFSTVSDRYAYAGVFALSWAGAALYPRLKSKWARVAAYSTIVLFGVLSFLQSGTWQNNEILYRHCLKVNPRSSMANNNLGKHFAEAKEFVKAEHYYSQAIALSNRKPEYLVNLSQVYKETEKYGSSLLLLEEALAREPDSIKTTTQAGYVSYKLEYWNKTLRYFKKAVGLGEVKDEYYVFMGVALFESGKIRESLSMYRKALSINAKNADAYNNMGASYHALGIEDSARHFLELASTIDPEAGGNLTALQNVENGRKSDSLNALGTSFAKKNDIEKAKKLFFEAINYSDKNFSALYNYARTLRMQDSCGKAIPYYAKASAQTSDYPQIFYEYAVCLFYSGNYEESKAQLKTAIALSPENQEYSALLTKLKAANDAL